jgi:hypothetical protein
MKAIATWRRRSPTDDAPRRVMPRGRHRGSRGYVFRVTALVNRKSELATMQDRLLNAYLANTIDEATYNATWPS